MIRLLFLKCLHDLFYLSSTYVCLFLYMKLYLQELFLHCRQLIFAEIYSCPMKTPHSSVMAYQKVFNIVLFRFIIYDKCNPFAQKKSILVTTFTHDVAPASNPPALRLSHFGRIQKDPEIPFKRFLFASRFTVDSPQLCQL